MSHQGVTGFVSEGLWMCDNPALGQLELALGHCTANTIPGKRHRDLIRGEGVLLVQVSLFLLPVGPQRADFPIISPFPLFCVQCGAWTAETPCEQPGAGNTPNSGAATSCSVPTLWGSLGAHPEVVAGGDSTFSSAPAAPGAHRRCLSLADLPSPSSRSARTASTTSASGTRS